MTMQIEEFHAMIGKTMVKVTDNGDEMLFAKDTEGTKYAFYHVQDCCESVGIEDTIGDLDDLVGSPILGAEEINQEPPKDSHEYGGESGTWTFYRYSTVRGTVTVRWYGSSNGYYSESVSYEVRKPGHRG